MRILIFNWRSVNDPFRGGAELATFEHAKRWVSNHKAKVTWLSPRYDNNIDRETIDGVDFQYVGFPLTRNIFQLLVAYPIYCFLIIWTYMIKFRGHVDVVIDEVHGLPYLTPLFVKEKIVVYIHEVAGEIWDLMYPFPINKIGKLLEKICFLSYKKTNFVGTKIVAEDLVKLNIPEKNINIVNYGVTAPDIKNVPTKNNNLTIVFLNRLVKMKGPERAIGVFSKVLKKDKNAKLIIIGRGEEKYEKELTSLANKLNIDKQIEFKGFVSTEEKFKLLGQSHALINASYKEGWGLVNIEANRMGTPVVAFKVKGNTTTVREGVSGFLFSENEQQQMADRIVELKNNTQIRQSAQNYSLQFDWDKSSNQFYEAFKK